MLALWSLVSTAKATPLLAPFDTFIKHENKLNQTFDYAKHQASWNKGIFHDLKNKNHTPFLINSTPVLTANAVCEGDTVLINANTTALSGEFILKDVNGSTIGTGILPNHDFQIANLPVGVHYFEVVIEDNGVITFSANTTVEVKAKVAPIINPISNICSGNSTTIEASGNNVSWFSDVNLINLVHTGNIFTTPNLNTNTSYFVINTENNCASDISIVNVGVDNLPSVPSIVTDTICAGETATLNASGNNLAWFEDNNAINPIANGTTLITNVLTQNTTYYVQQTDANGCISPLAPVAVIVNTLPQAPTATVHTECFNDTVKINAVSVGTGNFLLYNSNNVLIQTLPLPNANFAIAGLDNGNHTFFLEVDNGTCKSPLTKLDATINHTIARPNVSNHTVCKGQAATLRATGTNLVWYSDSRLTQEVNRGNEFHIPSLNSSATYYVVSINDNCKSEVSTVTASLHPVLGLTTNYTTDTICAGETATLTASNNNAIMVWFADANGNLELGRGQTFVTPRLFENTNYYLRQINIFGCIGEARNIEVIVNNVELAPQATANDVCQGDDLIINALAVGNGNFILFDENNNAIDTLPLPNANFQISGLASGSYTFFVAVDNGNCISPLTTVTANIKATANTPTLTNHTICNGETATITANGTNLVWFSDAALTNQIATGNTFITPALYATTQYFVVSMDNNCQSDITIATITVQPLTNAPLATTDTICIGQPATISAIGNNLTWFEDANANNQIATGNTLTTAPLAQNTTFYVQDTDVNGCLSTITAVEVEVNAVPQMPQAIANDVCQGDDLIINALAVGNGNFILFDENNNAIDTLPLPNANFQISGLASGSYTFFVAVDNGNCISPLTTVTANIKATANTPTLTNHTICNGETATITANGTNLVWFSDAALTNQIATGNTFITPALYATTQYFVVSMDNNCQSDITIATITVQPLTNAPLATTDTICIGQPATISAIGNNLTWFEDANANNQIATGNTLTTAPLAQNTTFYVQDTDVNGCLSTITAVEVEVNAVPRPPVVTSNNICQGEDLIISASTTGIGTFILYDNNFVAIDSLPLPNADFTVTDLGNGNFIYYVAVNNGACISEMTPIRTVVNALPNAPVATNDSPVCEGEDVVLQASPVNGASYLWTGPNGFEQMGQTIFLDEITPAQAGTYSVVMTLGNCTSIPATTEVIVMPKPNYTGTILSNSPLCEGEDMALTAPEWANATYTWNGPNGFTSNDRNVTINNVRETRHQGVYNVFVTDANGCISNTVATLVNVNPNPNSFFIASNGPICEFGTLNLMVPVIFDASYEWTGPNGFTSTDRENTISNFARENAGTYSVEITVGGCAAAISTEVNILTIDNATLTNDTTIIQGNNVQLNATGGVTYHWTGDIAYLSHTSISNPVFSGRDLGTFDFKVQIYSNDGCMVERNMLINVVADEVLVFTDLFTPNGDGINDTWEIGNLQHIGNYTLTIYSRAGFEVLRTENYNNDWDGTHNGTPLADGTYWYVLVEENGVEHRGAITIKR